MFSPWSIWSQGDVHLMQAFIEIALHFIVRKLFCYEKQAIRNRHFDCSTVIFKFKFMDKKKNFLLRLHFCIPLLLFFIIYVNTSKLFTFYSIVSETVYMWNFLSINLNLKVTVEQSKRRSYFLSAVFITKCFTKNLLLRKLFIPNYRHTTKLMHPKFTYYNCT